MNSRISTFLRRLHAGGRSNMYGAVPHLMQHFSLDRHAAFRAVCHWVDAQDAAELASAAGHSRSPRLPERTPPAARRSRKRSASKS